MRVAELMTDFRSLQRHLASIRVTYAPENQNLEGYVVLRQCMTEAQAILNQPFQSSSVHPRGDEEQEKTQLRQYVHLMLEKGNHIDMLRLGLSWMLVYGGSRLKRSI